jgi:transcriptional regulator with XRE-family HTH domain
MRGMITGAQVQAARALLRWTARDLASRAVVSVSTINLIENADGVPSKTRAQLDAVQSTLEVAGIEFIDTVGVQLRPHKKRRGK